MTTRTEWMTNFLVALILVSWLLCLGVLIIKAAKTLIVEQSIVVATVWGVAAALFFAAGIASLITTEDE